MTIHDDPIRTASNILISLLNKLYLKNSSQYSVSLFWSPSHVGIPGNERVDLAAKTAATVGKSTYHKHYKPFHNLLALKWQSDWLMLEHASPLSNKKLRQAISLLLSAQKRPWSTLPPKGRLTHGHYVQGRYVTPVCDWCRVVITTKHVLLLCPKYKRTRVLYHGCSR